MKSCCCYIADQNYLFPTFLSAIQARQATDPRHTTVRIFCVGQPTPQVDRFTALCGPAGVELVVVPNDAIDGMPIMFARFYLDRLLDRDFGPVIYLDGDTQITGSLAPLLDALVRSGPFLASRDPMSFVIDEPGRTWRQRRSYFASIGMPDRAMHRYCNSGVVRFNRSDWGEISRRVLRSAAAGRNAFQFPDQDPLNIAFGADYEIMSSRWNFPIFLMNYGFESLLKPRVYHFMSNPRPWHGPFRPWGTAWHRPYLDLLKAHPDLATTYRRLSRLQQLRYRVQQPAKAVLEGGLWRSKRVRERIMRNESEAVA